MTTIIYATIASIIAFGAGIAFVVYIDKQAWPRW